MDVVNAEQARIAEDAGAVAVMALERIPGKIVFLELGWPLIIVDHVQLRFN